MERTKKQRGTRQQITKRKIIKKKSESDLHYSAKLFMAELLKANGFSVIVEPNLHDLWLFLHKHNLKKPYLGLGRGRFGRTPDILCTTENLRKPIWVEIELRKTNKKTQNKFDRLTKYFLYEEIHIFDIMSFDTKKAENIIKRFNILVETSQILERSNKNE